MDYVYFLELACLSQYKMGLINISAFLLTVQLINLDNIDNFSSENFQGTLGINPGVVGS